MRPDCWGKPPVSFQTPLNQAFSWFIIKRWAGWRGGQLMPTVRLPAGCCNNRVYKISHFHKTAHAETEALINILFQSSLLSIFCCNLSHKSWVRWLLTFHSEPRPGSRGLVSPSFGFPDQNFVWLKHIFIRSQLSRFSGNVFWTL